MEDRANSGDVFALDPLVLRVLTTLYAPTAEIQDLGDEGERFIGELALKRCGIIPATSDALQRAAYHAAESGMPNKLLLDWARLNDAEHDIRQGIVWANRDAARHASALLLHSDQSLPRTKRVLQVSDQVARVAYGNERRDAGTPYDDHPKSVGAIALHGLKTLRQHNIAIHPHLITAAVCVSRLHDAGEKSQYTPDPFDPVHPFAKYTPLSIRHLFKQAGIRYSVATANTLRLVTHYPKLQIWATPYEIYILLGTVEKLFRLIKYCDIHHNNVLEPKPVPENDLVAAHKFAQKQQDYFIGKQVIRDPTPQPGIEIRDEPWLKDFFDIVDSVQPRDMPMLIAAYEAYIGYPNDQAIRIA